MMEVHQRQFAWLLEQAREHPELLRGEDPLPISVYRARQVGITPRAIARELGMGNSDEIREMLRRIKERVRKDPHLARLCEIP